MACARQWLRLERGCALLSVREALRKLVENALLVRRGGLEALEPVLRVYEGCARALLGEVEGANVLTLH